MPPDDSRLNDACLKLDRRQQSRTVPPPGESLSDALSALMDECRNSAILPMNLKVRSLIIKHLRILRFMGAMRVKRFRGSLILDKLQWRVMEKAFQMVST